MKKAILYFSFLFLLPFQIMAQGCLPEGIAFTTQEEIDQFPQMHPNCTEIEGMVTINGDNIKNLDSLYAIISIDNSLHIFSCDSLTSLLGISALQFLKELTIENNGNLAEITGFNNLSTLNNMSIFDNENMLKIDGFINLDSINGDFIIRNCANMVEFNAFDQLQFIGGDLEFIFNRDLTYCPEFKVLAHIEGNFSFIRNNEIPNFMGFDSLSIIGGSIIIDNNANLMSLSGLHNLTTIGNDLSIKYDTALHSLNGLTMLESIGGDVDIWHNDKLTSLEGINNLLSIGGELSMYDNLKLSSIEALISLQFLGSGLVIQENNELTILMGLNNITSVGGGRLYIKYNDKLYSLQGINNIDYQTIGDLHIVGNPNLFNCEVESICDWVNDYTGVSHIMSNAYGCNDVNEIHRACNAIGEDVHSFPRLIDHPTWSVLECDQTTPLHCNSNSYQYIKDSTLCWRFVSIIEIGEHTAYVRSDGPKTYFRNNKTCWKEEYLLYDFDLEIGDMVEVGWNLHLPASNSTERKKVLQVTDKHTIKYLDQYRLRLQLKYDENKYMYWVEGIGSLTHPFYPYMDLSKESDNYFELLCLDSLWTPLYQNPEWNVCDTIVDGILDNEYFDGIIISPNPFNSQLTIYSSNEKIQQIKVYSITGKLIKNLTPANNQSTTLTLNQNTPQGIYLVQIFTENKMIQRKIMKL